MSHIFIDSPTSVSRDGGPSPISLGKELLSSASHVGYSLQTTASHVGRMDVNHKSRRRSFKPKFPCNICKGNHLNHLCPGILVV